MLDDNGHSGTKYENRRMTDLIPVAYDPLSRLVCAATDADALRDAALRSVAAALVMVEFVFAVAAYLGVSVVVALLVTAHIGLKAGDVVGRIVVGRLKAVYAGHGSPFLLGGER